MRPLRAFPLGLGVGTDICHIARIHSILGGPRRGRFVRRILAPEEVAAAEERLLLLTGEGRLGGSDADGAGPVRRTALWKMAAFVAGRFAAKEAAMKAHGRRLGWHDIVIEQRQDGSGSGPPVARIRTSGRADDCALVSISHDGDYATAVCIACDAGRQAA